MNEYRITIRTGPTLRDTRRISKETYQCVLFMALIGIPVIFVWAATFLIPWWVASMCVPVWWAYVLRDN